MCESAINLGSTFIYTAVRFTIVNILSTLIYLPGKILMQKFFNLFFLLKLGNLRKQLNSHQLIKGH